MRQFRQRFHLREVKSAKVALLINKSAKNALSYRWRCKNERIESVENFCYLFGSYAKGKETPASDVDLLIAANVKGLRFYGLVEELRGALRKKVDVLDMNQLKDNLQLTEEIFKDGIKIYG